MTIITYEHPLNEQIRICLRLEYLFKEVSYHLPKADAKSSLAALTALLKITNVIDRPDLKAKLTQILRQNMTVLGQLKQAPNVDETLLNKVIAELDFHLEKLHQQIERFGENLRSNEFLHHARLQANNPGGFCDYMVPSVKLWLEQSATLRIEDLTQWYQSLKNLDDIIALILRLTRESAEQEKADAKDGFYHCTLNAYLPCSMVRVNLPVEYGLYPEFSSDGKYRLSIRFVAPNYHQGRPVQPDKNFEFDLTLCRV